MLDVDSSPLALPQNHLHVWRARLEAPPNAFARLLETLSDDERARARRFRFERDRLRYVVGRALLRALLARYLDIAPAHVRFRYGAHGKPELAGAGPVFNLSHSGALALYAFTADGELGIDVELDDADFARERIAERFFSPAEVRALRTLPANLQPRAFLTCWTRKEAFIKARGDGLSLPLDSFDVSLGPEAPPALLRTAWSAEEPASWRVLDLSDRAAGYIAAVALRSNSAEPVELSLLQTNEGATPGQENE